MASLPIHPAASAGSASSAALGGARPAAEAGAKSVAPQSAPVSGESSAISTQARETLRTATLQQLASLMQGAASQGGESMTAESARQLAQSLAELMSRGELARALNGSPDAASLSKLLTESPPQPKVQSQTQQQPQAQQQQTQQQPQAQQQQTQQQPQSQTSPPSEQAQAPAPAQPQVQTSASEQVQAPAQAQTPMPESAPSATAVLESLAAQAGGELAEATPRQLSRLLSQLPAALLQGQSLTAGETAQWQSMLGQLTGQSASPFTAAHVKNFTSILGEFQAALQSGETPADSALAKTVANYRSTGDFGQALRGLVEIARPVQTQSSAPAPSTPGTSSGASSSSGTASGTTGSSGSSAPGALPGTLVLSAAASGSSGAFAPGAPPGVLSSLGTSGSSGAFAPSALSGTLVSSGTASGSSGASAPGAFSTASTLSPQSTSSIAPQALASLTAGQIGRLTQGGGSAAMAVHSFGSAVRGHLTALLGEAGAAQLTFEVQALAGKQGASTPGGASASGQPGAAGGASAGTAPGGASGDAANPGLAAGAGGASASGASGAASGGANSGNVPTVVQLPVGGFSGLSSGSATGSTSSVPAVSPGSVQAGVQGAGVQGAAVQAGAVSSLAPGVTPESPTRLGELMNVLQGLEGTLTSRGETQLQNLGRLVETMQSLQTGGSSSGSGSSSASGASSSSGLGAGSSAPGTPGAQAAPSGVASASPSTVSTLSTSSTSSLQTLASEALNNGFTISLDANHSEKLEGVLKQLRNQGFDSTRLQLDSDGRLRLTVTVDGREATAPVAINLDAEGRIERAPVQDADSQKTGERQEGKSNRDGQSKSESQQTGAKSESQQTGSKNERPAPESNQAARRGAEQGQGAQPQNAARESAMPRGGERLAAGSENQQNQRGGDHPRADAQQRDANADRNPLFGDTHRYDTAAQQREERFEKLFSSFKNFAGEDASGAVDEDAFREFLELSAENRLIEYKPIEILSGRDTVPEDEPLHAFSGAEREIVDAELIN